MTSYTIVAEPRNTTGRHAARRLRRQGLIPGVVYGMREPLKITIQSDHLVRQIRQELFHSSLINLTVEGQVRTAVLREMQTHPLTKDLLHVDFQEVAQDRPISASVPIHYINASSCPGVKLNQGVFSALLSEVQVHCLPKNLPEFINIDVETMNIGDSIHLSSVPAPEGVTFDTLVRGDDLAIAAVLAPKIAADSDSDAESDELTKPEAESEGSDADTPEIGK